jgi:SAM-dependent methyltransferase
MGSAVAEYSKDFFEWQRDGSLTSARVLVPIILDYVPARSVCDVGCGVGTWLRAFREAQVEEIQGFDGDYVDRAMLQIPPGSFTPSDLSRPPVATRTYDLAISLEVAEHLPEASARLFVAYLTSLAPVVVFSGAIPGQGGHGHVNEQWQSYWVRLFRQQGYVAVDCLRARVWDEAGVEFWYKQNMLLYVRDTKLPDYPKLAEAASRGVPLVFDVVHPGQHTKDLVERPDEYFLETVFKLPTLFRKAVARRLA